MLISHIYQKDNKIIYLLGTIHAARLDKALSQPVITLLSHAKVLMIEHPISNPPYEFSEQEKLGDSHDSLKAAIKNQDEEHIFAQLLQNLTAKKEFLYTNMNQTQEFDFVQLLQYKLWVADLLLTVDLTLKAMTQNGGEMEHDLISAIKGQMIPLETTQEIYDIMNQNTEENSVYIQRFTVNLKTLQRSTINLNSFLKMDEYTFAKISGMRSHPPAIGKRNMLWIHKIMSAFANLREHESMVVAVGTGHLSGSEGLLKLLSDQGFTISALNKDAQEVNLPPTLKFY